MTVKNISILGCGWLGLPLAIDFVSKGIKVKGSTTTEAKIAALKSENIKPYLLTLGEINETIYTQFISGSDVIIINIPPKRIPNIITIYLEQIERILPFINDTQKVVFISSTSVYQNTNGEVFEDLKVTPEKPSGQAILKVEQKLQAVLKNRVTIIRFSGLIGYDRQPGRFLANKKEFTNAIGPVNIIHRDDCIGLIQKVIEHNAWGETINGCADKHPTRQEFYTLAAKKLGVTPPEFIEEESLSYKIVSNAKSKELLGYSYLYADPLVLVE
jgi:nucleoside-diphosphate-sugar epimerase